MNATEIDLIAEHVQKSPDPDAWFAAFAASAKPGADLKGVCEKASAGCAVKLSAAWDEKKHKRGQPGNAGEFGPGGNAANQAKQPAGTDADPHSQAIVAAIVDRIDGRKCAPETLKLRVAAVQQVLGAATPKMLQAIASGCEDIYPHEDVTSVTASFDKHSDVKADAHEVIAGFYTRNSGQVHFDGGKARVNGSIVRADEDGNGAGTAAHEFGHAIDREGNAWKSADPAWQKAWQSEIRRGDTPLSRYAMTNATEGFAEFARLLMSVKDGHRIAQDGFPGCYEFWQQKGIV